MARRSGYRRMLRQLAQAAYIARWLRAATMDGTRLPKAVSWAMSGSETEKEMCARHVREGELHVTRQRRIIADLRAGDHPIRLAEQLLIEFERTLLDHRAHLARAIAAEAAADVDARANAGADKRSWPLETDL